MTYFTSGEMFTCLPLYSYALLSSLSFLVIICCCFLFLETIKNIIYSIIHCVSMIRKLSLRCLCVFSQDFSYYENKMYYSLYTVKIVVISKLEQFSPIIEAHLIPGTICSIHGLFAMYTCKLRGYWCKSLNVLMQFCSGIS